MGNSKEYGQPDRWRVGECRHLTFPVGIQVGGSDVRSRYGHPLVTYRLETAIQALVQCNAVMADGDDRLPRHHRYLPVRHGRYATLYLLPVLI